ncbi:MAG: GH3 auxin-responsive promoter family protein [Raineya sp.]
MGFRSFLAKPLASFAQARQEKWAKNPILAQEKVFQNLIQKAKNTLFGKDHHFEAIQNIADFQKNVPIRDYEGLRPYIDQVVAGKEDILWQGKPLYFAKTSGTTSGVKYIPISKDSIHNHINGAKNALLNYIYQTGKADFVDRKLIFLSGSPVLENKNGILTGRLSGISNHHVPSYLRTNQLPSWKTNCIEDWEEKLEKIIDETLHQDMSLISGIPPWVQMYFDRIEARTGKKIKDVFPNFSLLIYGGVNFEPYKNKLYESIGKKIDGLEMFPASEGFFAYQDTFGERKQEGMLLLLDTGIFYEFVPAEEYFNENPTRLTIGEVELNKNYALILSNNAGLWAYSIGDTVKFVSKNPYRVIVSGRIKHFISAFGEHVIGEEVEKAMKFALEQFPETEVIEFTVAPQVTPQEGLPHHEWLISFAKMPRDLVAFSKVLDKKMTELNVYYDDLISGAILCPLKITCLQSNAFIEYMKSLGKLGGQNKVPRLSNDRQIADALQKYKV